jgi:site-specific recombinase XerD
VSQGDRSKSSQLLPFSELQLGIIRGVSFGLFSENQEKQTKGKIPMPKRFFAVSEKLCRFDSGPMGVHLQGFAALLSRQGYTEEAGWAKIRVVRDFSRWLARRHVEIEKVDENQVAVFLKARLKHTFFRSGEKVTLALLLKYLRQNHIIPAHSANTVQGPADLIVQDYRDYLVHERSLGEDTIKGYIAIVLRFLLHHFPDQKVELKKLRAQEVGEFVLHDTTRQGRRACQHTTTALRSFFGFLFQNGKVATNLAMSVPTVAGWRLSELPHYLEPADVEKVLDVCDCRRKVGKRNYAILLLLARLGLRAGEVVSLALDDIDWTAGELRIHGKGSRVDKLPLLEDVGGAIADYLQKARPRCSSRRVFVHMKAPYEGFARPCNGICCIVRRALKAAKLNPPHKGAHILRHSLATRMLRNGASLSEIGRVLRHQGIQTTEIYAKVNVDALRTLAQPWPGGVQ